MTFYFITGVSSGIGLALVQALLASKEELMVYGCSRRPVEIKDSRFKHYTIDLSDTKALEKKAVQLFSDDLNKVHQIVLINNAGTIGDIDFVGHQSVQHYQQVMNTNSTAVMIFCELFIQRFQHTTAQKIILNISSGAAQKDIAGWAAYCASKAAIDRFTSVCAEEQRSQSSPVHLYSVSPGVVDTAMQQQIRKSTEAQLPSLKRFRDLFAKRKLLPAETAATKVIRLINEPTLRTNILLSLRDL